MTNLEGALKAASMGFYVHPLREGTKIPALPNWQELATRDKKQITKWFTNGFSNANVGISTSKFKESEALLVVDVDQKEGKMGANELLRLEIVDGMEFPPTVEQTTPSGGRHLIYKTTEIVRNSVEKLGPGLDIRAGGGNLAFAGSVLSNGEYVLSDGDVMPAPEWLVSYCGRSSRKSDSRATRATFEVDRENAISRATFYLENEAPLALQGAGGDQTTYIVAAHVKDFGVSEGDCLELMSLYWNDRCAPKWSATELQNKVSNAYRYGAKPQGAESPEAVFSPIPPDAYGEDLSPIEKLNKEFAFVVAGGGAHILWETTGPRNEFKVEHLNIPTFHQLLASRKMAIGDKTKKVSEVWMGSEDRRSYDGICFMPKITPPERFYNLWHGFSVEPYAANIPVKKQHQETLNEFLEHAKENICAKDDALFKWLISYFAQLVQIPSEKPHSAIVFKGDKGVGKNFFIEQIGRLLGSHFLLTSNPRYLLSNFNSHLENCLLFVLDEAFWSGDKKAEGILKDLITGSSHFIEHKGKESYSVDNCTRVAILGNEDWVVPASQGERRFAVFNVGNARKQDTAYFTRIAKGMKAGANRLLLKYLLDFNYNDVDLNNPPNTAGLLEQKISSLDNVQSWWFSCLTNGEIVGSDFGGQWPAEVEKARFWAAFRRHIRERNVKSWTPENTALGRSLKKCLTSLDNTDKKSIEGHRVNIYKLPPLSESRAQWETFIGHTCVWSN